LGYSNEELGCRDEKQQRFFNVHYAKNLAPFITRGVKAFVQASILSIKKVENNSNMIMIFYQVRLVINYCSVRLSSTFYS